jgi:ornithine--oxo-acid transaminase
MLSNADVMDVFGPGDHGSTFGGNPLGCATGMAALQVIEEESLVERAFTLGKYFREELEKIQSPYVQEVRGKGLLIGVEIKKEHGTARPFCERLMKLGLLCKETHDYTIRFAPPLTITKDEIDWSLEKIAQVLT